MEAVEEEAVAVVGVEAVVVVGVQHRRQLYWLGLRSKTRFKQMGTGHLRRGQGLTEDTYMLMTGATPAVSSKNQ